MVNLKYRRFPACKGLQKKDLKKVIDEEVRKLVIDFPEIKCKEGYGICSSKPSEILPNEWAYLSLDGEYIHWIDADSLEEFWENQIAVGKERSCSSHMLQVNDISVFKSISSFETKALAQYRTDHEAPLNEFEFVAIYKWCADNAITKSNIQNGFRAAGIFPLQTSDEWLAKNAMKFGIKMTMKEKNVQKHQRTQKPTI